jgi:regulator of sigma E protease
MFEVFWSLAAFIVAIGLLVSFHEYGHYWVARRCGVKVLRFSIGFGRPIWMRRGRDGTEWVVAAIPLGGYVKMLDEREAEVPEQELHRAFNRQSVWRRIAIVIAGPVFNFALAAMLYWAILVIGSPGLKPVVDTPPAGSAGALAGLQRGDTVVALEGTAIPTWQILRTELIDRALTRGEVRMEVLRQGAERPSEVWLPLGGVRVDPEHLFNDIGLLPFSPQLAPILAEIMPRSAAERAGLRPGDRLLRGNGETIDDWNAWAQWLRARPGEVVEIEFEREGQALSVSVLLDRDRQGGDWIGRLGASVEVPADLWQDLRAEYRLGPLAAVPAAGAQTWQMSWLTLKMLHRMVLGDVSVKNVSGPIQIAQYAGYSASIGLVSFLAFLAIVSVSLGVLNLLPIPLLDGGHLLYYLIEIIKGSPLSERAELAGQQIGLLLLALLMGLAFYNDIMRLVG